MTIMERRMMNSLELYSKAISDAIVGLTSREGSISLSGSFQELLSIVGPRSQHFFLANSDSKVVMQRIRVLLDFAESDWRNLFKICLLMDYMDFTIERESHDLVIVGLTSLEVALHAFHTEMRSLLDYVAALCSYICGGPITPDTPYFGVVLKTLSANKNSLRPDLVSIVTHLEDFQIYYDAITLIRNAIVHKGADAMVVLGHGGLYGRPGFIINSRSNDLISRSDFDFPSEVFETGAIDLKVYVGLCLGC